MVLMKKRVKAVVYMGRTKTIIIVTFIISIVLR